VGGRDLQHICATMRSDDPQVLATACRAVAAIATDPEGCRVVSASGAVRDILAAIQLHSANHDLLHYACAALDAMAAHCDGARDIMDAGGKPPKHSTLFPATADHNAAESCHLRGHPAH